MNCTEVYERSESEFVCVHQAVVSLLTVFVDPSVSWCWILGHRPKRAIQWWETTVPLNPFGQTYNGLIRDVAYDLQMPTSEFIARAADFDDHGLALIQSDKPMPDTLCLDQIPGSQQAQVLIKNEASLRIYLPHAWETAQVQSFRKGYLARIIS